MADKTSISTGLIIYKLLTEDPEVSGMVTRVFPVAVLADKAVLPYVVFRAKEMDQLPVRNPMRPNDTVMMELLACGKDYETSVTLAEAVRSCLDNIEATEDGLRMRSCMMTDREETYEDGAFVQVLTFTIRI